MNKFVATVAVAATLATSTACDSFGQAMSAHKDLLARAGGHELSIDKAASLFALNARIPAQPDVVNAIANLWIDYTLLATAVAKDSTLNAVNLDPIIEPYIEQEVVWRLRDKVIKVDTALDDARLRAMFEQSGTGTTIKARHVLLRLPAEATPVQRDSVTRLANDIRDRARKGADFAALARQYSQEPGAQQSGGDLGFFGRGQMVAPFEQAAFAMQVGQVSDIVETPFGLHIIKVEEKKTGDFESAKGTFREEAKNRLIQEAEQNYVKSLTDTMNIVVEPGSYEVVRELAGQTSADVSGRAARRELVEYKGGEVTAGDYARFLQRLQPQQRQMIASQSDDNLKQLLEGLARNEILVAEAGRQNLQVPKQQLDSVRNEIKNQLRTAISEAQLNTVKAQAGQSMDEAIQQRVMALLEGNIRGDRPVIPLGPISYSLREQYGAQIFERAVAETVQKVEATRAQNPVPQPGLMPGQPGQAPPTGQLPQQPPVEQPRPNTNQ
ncbi:MAG TPA: peptidylprolyl isomerase [Longimicrobiales bacterium]|nr:peptidylprolyl isomerase [Longimicrobiales bacterium]